MTVRIFVGDCRDVMRTMKPQSVHCVVTSPPYWGLRDYGIEPSVWGGDPNCEHDWTDHKVSRKGSTNGREDLGSTLASVGSAKTVGAGSTNDARGLGQHRTDRSAFCRCGAWRGTFGLEPTYQLYIEHSVEIFREVWRVLRDDGTLWLNLGDSYATGAGKAVSAGGGAQGDAWTQRGPHPQVPDGPDTMIPTFQPNRMPQPGLKPKDLCGIPWRVAFALQADGWWLRQDIIWCLSGGTWLYARTASKVGPMMLKDLARLDPETVELWSGERWTRVTAWTRRKGRAGAAEIVLRSGERIGCTDNHVWPLARGDVRTDELRRGDIVTTAKLPTGERRAGWLTEDAFWFAGLFLAEGSRSGETIQISGHVKEESRLARIRDLIAYYGGSARAYNHKGKAQNIHIDSVGLSAVLRSLVAGRTAKNKRLHPGAWHYRDWALRQLATGYLEGDGYHEEENARVRLGFCRNYGLERDLRTLAARLGATLTLKPAFSKNKGKSFPSFRGEWRWSRSGHRNERDRGEVIEVRRSRARQFWDVTVADHPNLFALASGVLTHNSKPNPMPESVTDRCTKSHEYLFMLTKAERYLFDQDAILEPLSEGTHLRVSQATLEEQYGSDRVGKTNGPMKPVLRKMATAGSGIKNNDSMDAALVAPGRRSGNTRRKTAAERGCPEGGGKNQCSSVPWEGFQRNKRSVWTVTTTPFKEAHFATFPPALIEPCVKAGTSEYGCCQKCGAPFIRLQDRVGPDGSTVTVKASDRFAKREDGSPLMGDNAYTPDELTRGAFSAKDGVVEKLTAGWVSSCECSLHTVNGKLARCIVLDPFGGAGTTALVADRLQRDAVLIELNPEYAAMADRRIRDEAGMLAKVIVEVPRAEAAE